MNRNTNFRKVESICRLFINSLYRQAELDEGYGIENRSVRSPWRVHLIDTMDEDDGMNVEGYHIYLNRNIIAAAGTFFGLLFALHEIYHAIEQNFLTKEPAIRLKDIQATSEFIGLDIEADVITALFLKKLYGWTFERYVQIYFQGQTIFKPEGTFKSFKLLRFIGSMVSIYQSYQVDKLINSRLYPSFLESDTEEKWVLVSDVDGRKKVKVIATDTYNRWRFVYEDGQNLTVYQYTETLLSLVQSYNIYTTKVLV